MFAPKRARISLAILDLMDYENLEFSWDDVIEYDKLRVKRGIPSIFD